MSTEHDLYDAEETLKELKQKRTNVGDEAKWIISAAVRKVLELYEAHHTKESQANFETRLWDVVEEWQDYVSGESENLFLDEEKDLNREIEGLISKVQSEERAHEKSYTQPY